MATRAVLLVLPVLVACQAESPPVSVPAPQPLAAEAPPPVRPKNVLLITIDTLRADYLSSYGGPASTPSLDALARDGFLFERCVSPSMLTNPSHASLMTSLYVRDHGVLDNESGLADGSRTLADALLRRGFQTGAVISFPHLNPEVSNLGLGFVRVDRATRDEPTALETTQRVLSMIDRLDREQPFFVWAHYVDPHAPYEPPGDVPIDAPKGETKMRVAQRAAPSFQRNNPWFKKAFDRYAWTEELVARYIAEIEHTDRGVAALLDGLGKRGLDEQTLLVITSDHGENMGEHGLYFHHGGLYAPSVHVPLIVHGLNVPRGRSAALVSTLDVAPTILDWLDVPQWEPMRGDSLAGVMEGRSPGRDMVFSEHMFGQLVAVRSEEGLLIRHRKTTRQFPSYPFATGREETYTIGRDLTETGPLDPQGARAETLRLALEQYEHAGLRRTPRLAVAQDRESLRALGYVE